MDAVLSCPPVWEQWLPPETKRLWTGTELSQQDWGTLLLPVTAELTAPVSCRCLLVEGCCPTALLHMVTAPCVITYGLSHQDTLTFSSLREPVLCIQRTLVRPDGGVIEPREIPLQNLPLPPEQMLPLLGLRLLQIPLTELNALW